MLNDKKLTQEGGDNSTNLQGGTVIINQGITYQDAKEIALDVFKNNYLQLSQTAAETAMQRVEEFTNKFLTELKKRKPDAIVSMEDPGMQHAAFTSQKEYARTGDQDLSDMLVDVLVDRATQPERTLKQIVLDESIGVLPKLTTPQLDILAVLLLLRRNHQEKYFSIEEVKNSIQEQLSPFVKNLSNSFSDYQHLQYASCISIGVPLVSLGDLFWHQYPSIFFKGFTKEDFEATGVPIDAFPELIIPCAQNEKLFQVNACTDTELDKKIEYLNIPHGTRNIFWWFMTTKRMLSGEIEDFMKKLTPFMEDLFSTWNNSFLKSSALTSVGIAIATANVRRKTSIKIELSDWMK